MAPAVPDRWLNYCPIGKQVAGTRFIAFKVPLRKEVNESVTSCENRLDTSKLLREVPNLGLIIDLTNTRRYYNPQTFKSEGVAHRKLMIPGHATPRNNLVKKFKDYVIDFLTNNQDNDKLIGVHCTHGVNRTGYLICNYMVSELAIEPKEAIERFRCARGHKIERENYLSALLKLKTRRCARPSRATQLYAERHFAPIRSLTGPVDGVENWRQRTPTAANTSTAHTAPPSRATQRYAERHSAPIRSRTGPVDGADNWRQRTPTAANTSTAHTAPPSRVTQRYAERHFAPIRSRTGPVDGADNWRQRTITPDRSALSGRRHSPSIDRYTWHKPRETNGYRDNGCYQQRLHTSRHESYGHARQSLTIQNTHLRFS